MTAKWCRLTCDVLIEEPTFPVADPVRLSNAIAGAIEGATHIDRLCIVLLPDRPTPPGRNRVSKTPHRFHSARKDRIPKAKDVISLLDDIDAWSAALRQDANEVLRRAEYDARDGLRSGNADGVRASGISDPTMDTAAANVERPLSDPVKDLILRLWENLDFAWLHLRTVNSCRHFAMPPEENRKQRFNTVEKCVECGDPITGRVRPGPRDEKHYKAMLRREKRQAV